MIFNNFVVIEFGFKGNAVYFYEREYFEENLIQYMNENKSVDNNQLKHTYKARNKRDKRVEKVNHYSSWEDKAHNKILKFS